MRRIKIYAQWQKEARVWQVSSADISGLTAEAGTLQDLEDRLNKIIPGLFEINGIVGEAALIISP